jgi:K+-sensing histidine kinase KdpD
MDAHKGSITARNHPDGGAVFEMRLPALKPPLRAETPANSRATMSLR